MPVNASAHDLLPVCVADVVNRLAPISERLREISDAEGGEFFIRLCAGIRQPARKASFLREVAVG
jgi:hypothetical protein